MVNGILVLDSAEAIRVQNASVNICDIYDRLCRLNGQNEILMRCKVEKFGEELAITRIEVTYTSSNVDEVFTLLGSSLKFFAIYANCELQSLKTKGQVKHETSIGPNDGTRLRIEFYQ